MFGRRPSPWLKCVGGSVHTSPRSCTWRPARPLGRARPKVSAHHHGGQSAPAGRVKHGFDNVEQFVLASTMLVHAPTQPGRPINEDWPLDPKWPYPQSKVETEQLIRAERGRIPTLILRPAGVYDERCRAVFLAQRCSRA